MLAACLAWSDGITFSSCQPHPPNPTGTPAFQQRLSVRLREPPPHFFPGYGLEFHPHLIIQTWLGELGTRVMDVSRFLWDGESKTPKEKTVGKAFSNCADFSYRLQRVSNSRLLFCFTFKKLIQFNVNSKVILNFWIFPPLDLLKLPMVLIDHHF